MRKPSNIEVHASQRETICPMCKVPAGTLCVGLFNCRHYVHMARVYEYISQVAPEPSEAVSRDLLLKLGWYLAQTDIAFKTCAPVSACALYIGGKLQKDRLHISLIETACFAGWVRLQGHGRMVFIPTTRGVVATYSNWHPPLLPWPRSASAESAKARAAARVVNYHAH